MSSSMISTKKYSCGVGLKSPPQTNGKQTFHKLNDTWNVYVHFSHDTNWDLSSYKKMMTINSVEEAVAFLNSIPDSILKNTMLFNMKNNIKPIWEDPNNKNGGCFSFKVSNKNIQKVWNNLNYAILGNTISDNKDFISKINGITISPKKTFCIMKIWMSDNSFKNISIMNDIPNVSKNGVIFKKHNPDY